LELETWNLELLLTWNLELGTWNLLRAVTSGLL
jgi:hypothetical protein